jgi:hypothetical protein
LAPTRAEPGPDHIAARSAIALAAVNIEVGKEVSAAFRGSRSDIARPASIRIAGDGTVWNGDRNEQHDGRKR